MSNNRPNPNRALPPDQVVQLFQKSLPQHVSSLGADRNWLWFSSEGKPDDETRAALKEIGFCYTDRPHSLPDGRTARWYHSCGTAVFRRGSVSTRQQQLTPGRKRSEKQPARHNRMVPVESSSTEAFDDLARLADAFPS